MRTFWFMLIIILGCTQEMYAQEQYKVLFLNMSPIKIGGKEIYVNDYFEASEKIVWTNDKQVMKVLNMSNQKQSVIAAREFKGGRCKSISSYLTQNKRLSTRDGEALLLPQLQDFLTNTFYLIDSISVNVLMPIDENHFFYADYDYNGEVIHKRLWYTTQKFLVDFRLFSIDGDPIPPFETDIKVFYMDNVNNKVILITNKMHIIPID